MAYKVIASYPLYMPSCFWRTFTEYPYVLRAFQTCKEVHKLTGKSIVYHLMDLLYCILRYGGSINQYIRGEFYRLRNFERKNVITPLWWVKTLKKCNRKEYIHFFLNKVDFNKRFASYQSHEWIYSKEIDFKTFCSFIDRHPEAIFKPINLLTGIGVKLLTVGDFDSKEAYYKYFISGDNLLEEKIVQHPSMFFNNKSVNTIRVYTLYDAKKDKTPIILKTILRAGIGESVIDNYCAGGVIYDVDVELGVVSSKGLRENGEQCIVHPGTETVMLGYKIPLWHEMIDYVSRLAMEIPQCPIIGWDIVICEDRIDVIEGNHDPNYELLEFLGKKQWKKFVMQHLGI